MNLAKKLAAIVLVLIMIFSFAACSDETEMEIDMGTVNIGIITPGDIEEDPYSRTMFNLFKTGYQTAGVSDGQITEKTGVKAGDPAAMETAISDLTARGCRIIVGTDSAYYEELSDYAQKEENSEIFFLALGDYRTNGPDIKNLAVYTPHNYEAEYLEGIAAGLSSKTGKIGYVSDKSYSILQTADINAFLLGAQSVNPSAEVKLVVTDDNKAGIEKVKTAGCDVVYSRNYIVNEEEGTTYFTVPESVSGDMTLNKISGDAPEFISGPSFNYEVLYTKMLTNIVNEKFDDIKAKSWNIFEGIVDVSPATDSTVKTAVDKVRSRFLAGEDVIGKDLYTLNEKYMPGIAEL